MNVAPPSEISPFSYAEAFSRHRGVFRAEEQERLRSSRVAIIGMGGVGGVHLMTLTRMGIGKFTIADPDTFEVANFNRQYGASMSSVGRKKVEVMAEQAHAVNPELDIRILDQPVGRDNLDYFMEGADILVDGVDFYAIDARRLVFAEARRRGIWGVTAGPHACGTAWMCFDPQGVSFDHFFDLRDDMEEIDKIIAFSVGCVPTPLHLGYIDLNSYFNPAIKGASSVGLACNLAAGVTAAEVLKILLGRKPLRAAPWYSHFDAYRQKLVVRRLMGGNRHIWQLLKRWWFKRKVLQAQLKVQGQTP